jgi:hypothetical protein
MLLLAWSVSLMLATVLEASAWMLQVRPDRLLTNSCMAAGS